MPKLTLFGVDIEADGRAFSFPRTNLTATARLAADNKTISLTLAGDFEAASFAGVAGSLDCTITSGIVKLRPGASSKGTGQITLSVAGKPVVLSKFRLATASSTYSGVEFVASLALTDALSASFGPLDGFLNSSGVANWTESRLALWVKDIPGRVALVVEAPLPTISVVDQFGAGHLSPYLDQKGVLAEVRLESTAVLPAYRFAPNALHLNADVLDPTEDVDDVSNGWLFQHVVSEADLVARIEKHDSKWTTVSWALQAQEPGGTYFIAVPAIKDEHGHPLLLQTATEAPVNTRIGEAGPAAGGRPNLAVILGKPDEECLLDVTIVSIDPIKTYLCRRPAKPTLNTSPRTPYWVDDATGKVLSQETRPRQLNGLSRNVSLKTGTDRTAIASKLRLTPYMDRGGQIALTKPSLEFPADARMQLEIETAESAVTESGGAAPVLRRIAAAQAGAKVRLPLLDCLWAFADLSPQPGTGTVAKIARDWLEHLDRGLHDSSGSAFGQAVVPNYQHTDGLRSQPLPQPFTRIINPPPTSTKTGGQRDLEVFALPMSRLALPVPAAPATIALSAVLAASQTHPSRSAFGAADAIPSTTIAAPACNQGFVLGGTDTGDTRLTAARTFLDDARSNLSRPFDDFFKFWAGLLEAPIGITDTDWQQARQEIRRYLTFGQPELRDHDNWTLNDLVEASIRLSAAREVYAGNPPAILNFDDLKEEVLAAEPEDIDELINPESGTTPIHRLLQYAFAPPSMDFLKRAAEAITSNDSLHSSAILRKVFGGLSPAIASYFLQGNNSPAGFLAELLQGTPRPFEALEALWNGELSLLEDEVAETLDDLIGRYGHSLDAAVLKKILGDTADAAALLDIVRGLGYPLSRLSDLAIDTPDYLILGRNLRRPGDTAPADHRDMLFPSQGPGALWSRRFDFCRFGSGKAWDFFLDGDTTIVLKLGGNRDLGAIVREIHETTKAADRPDPLGLSRGAATADPVSDFLALLAPELMEPNWRGALIINPTIDLDRDQVLRTLCGFPHIGGRYVAIGGQAAGSLVQAPISVWGRVDKYAEEGDWVDETGGPGSEPAWGEGGDVGWSLTKFQATIRDTTIVSADIAFRLTLRELFGKSLRNETAPPGKEYQRINVSGTLSPQAAPGALRDLAFGANFENPLTVPIEISFLKELRLRGIKVGSHDSATSLDIDADLVCRDADFGFFDFHPSADPVRLSNVRIRIPELPSGRSLGLGLQRALQLDLGAIRFPIPPARQLAVAGIEIVPIAFGLLRGVAGDITRRLDSETMELRAPGFPHGAPPDTRYAYPYVDTGIEFGKSPGLGGAKDLKLVIRLGTPVGPPSIGLGTPGAGLSSLDARDLEISLFRLLTLSADRVRARVAKMINPNTGVPAGDAGTVLIDGFNLKIGNWSLFDPRDARTLLLANPVEENARAVLGFYAPEDPGSGFFKLYWLLLAKNLDPGHGLKNALLENLANDPKTDANRIRAILGGTEEVPELHAVVANEPWLFGVKFELGPLFRPCTLIFQDGLYYGIRLGGPIAELLTGEGDITFAYIPGERPDLDRFRTTFRVAALDAIASMRSGQLALEWSPSWDFLIDIGQPWRGPDGYDWERAFSIPVGIYEARFGFFIEKRTTVDHSGAASPSTDLVTFAAGAGFYLGYQFQAGNGVAWVRAGIGIFGVLIGSATLALPEESSSANPMALLRGTLTQLQVVGVIGIYAYGEGGVDVWILSARFRVSAQAFLEVTLTYIPHARSYLSYDAMLAAHYSASVRVGHGWFSWTFSVSGSVEMHISGRAAFG